MMMFESPPLASVGLNVWTPVAVVILYCAICVTLVAPEPPVVPTKPPADHEPFVVSESPTGVPLNSNPANPTIRPPTRVLPSASETVGAPDVLFELVDAMTSDPTPFHSPSCMAFAETAALSVAVMTVPAGHATAVLIHPVPMRRPPAPVLVVVTPCVSAHDAV